MRRSAGLRYPPHTADERYAIRDVIDLQKQDLPSGMVRICGKEAV